MAKNASVELHTLKQFVHILVHKKITALIPCWH